MTSIRHSKMGNPQAIAMKKFLIFIEQLLKS